VPRVVELSIKCEAAAGRWDRAARGAAELLRLYPEEPVPLVLASQVELARDHTAPALEYANNALDLDPFCVPAILTRSCLYARNGDFESSRVSYEKLMLFDDTALASVGHEGIAFADFLAGDFDDGVDAMDEAIRHAMMAGSRRRGLALATRMVEYLCQLGRADAAESVVERWVTEFGEIPVRLARRAHPTAQGRHRCRTTCSPISRARRSGAVVAGAVARRQRAHRAGRDRAGEAARCDGAPAACGEGAPGHRRERGRATHVSDRLLGVPGRDAETAAAAFAKVRERLFGLEFPYHGDPVLYVQSLFYRGEAQLASGKHAAAKESYSAFLTSGTKPRGTWMRSRVPARKSKPWMERVLHPGPIELANLC
jgi:tetratricopeptide (TPR) repeat protein